MRGLLGNLPRSGVSLFGVTSRHVWVLVEPSGLRRACLPELMTMSG